MSEASNLAVTDLTGKTVTLDAITGDVPTLFVFVRHFG